MIPRRVFAPVLAASLAASASAQAPSTLELGVDVIKLAVTVTDTGNNYIQGLKPAAFEVVEAGAPQAISLFTEKDSPITLVVMLDTSLSMVEKLPMVRAAATAFVETLGPNDRAQLLQFSDRARVSQDFTSDKESLEAAVRGSSASGATALHNALYTALRNLGAQKSAEELRRKAIVLLSDGEDTASVLTEDQVLDLARKSEVTIFAIDLLPRTPPKSRQRAAAERAQALLRTLTHETGGRLHRPASVGELDDVYAAIARELHSQYVIGYTSSNAIRDGKWRTISVRVKGRGELQLRHRTGYYAKRG